MTIPGTSREPASNQLLFYMEKKESRVLTTGWGAPAPDRGNALTVGPRGPMLLQDISFIEEMQRFNRERIPERVVHAKGAGAFGYFTVTDDITRFCKASIFSKIGKTTPLVVRFSTFVGRSGSSDTVRDTRGFALKFYTEEGNWDLLGNNSPVFFVRDPYLTFSYAHTQKKNPVTHLTDRDAGFDFFSLEPQTLHQIMFLFSDRGIPDGYRHIDGYAINTFKLVNAAGSAVYCKFNYKTDQGIKNLRVDEASRLSGTDPDYAIRDLYNAIAEGRHPSWTFYIQVMTFDQAETLPWNPFDPTKTWPLDEFPLIRVGKFVLTKNPNNYFVDVEQLGFSPGRMVPGIEASPDKVLQGRLNLYSDAQLYRLGTNYLQLPVNSPFRSPVFNTQRDGKACYTDNQDGEPNYYPSSFINQINSPRARIQPYLTHGNVKRYNSSDDDNFTQPRMFWLSFSEDEKQRTSTNIASSLKNSLGFIQERALKNFHEVDPRLAGMIRAALKVQS